MSRELTDGTGPERIARSPPWTARVVTLFPDAFPGVLGCSLVGKGLESGTWCLETIDLRAHGHGRHRNVDDTPAGGGPGMVLRADVVAEAVRATQTGVGDSQEDWPLICLTPRGNLFNQTMAEQWSTCNGVTIICGRFEGIDQRVVDEFAMQEISVGDFVLSGGEIAAQVLIEATVRLIPSVLGNRESVQSESFDGGLLEYPQYTRPVDWEGRAIPEVLNSGHHQKIAAWRQEQSEEITRTRRPDLWRTYRNKVLRNHANPGCVES